MMHQDCAGGPAVLVGASLGLVKARPEIDLAKSRRQKEAEIANAVMRFYRQRIGRGPDLARVFLVDDMVVVRQQGTLAACEAQLALATDGVEMLRQFRRKLMETLRGDLIQLIESLIERPVRELYSDTSPCGDRIDIFLVG